MTAPLKGFIIGSKNAQYGLITRKPGPGTSGTSAPGPAASGLAGKAVPAKPLQAFLQAEQDEDELDGSAITERERVNARLRREQAQVEINAKLAGNALDASVVDYDAWAEQEAISNPKSKYNARLAAKSTLSEPPKYLAAMKQKALERERVNRRVYERKLAKERDADEEQFGHLDRFVTAGYKDKLAADRAAEEEQAKRDAETRDVTSEEGMMGFYRGLFQSKSFGGAGAGAGSAAHVHAGAAVVEDVPPERGTKRSRSRSPSPAPAVSVGVTASAAPSVAGPAAATESTPAEPVAAPAAPAVQREDAPIAAPNPVPAKRTTEDAAAAARERFLARQAAKRAATTT